MFIGSSVLSIRESPKSSLFAYFSNYLTMTVLHKRFSSLSTNFVLGFMLTVILYAVGLLRPVYPVMFLAGSLSAWLYLRFWQAHPNGSRGDPAEHFSFAHFFPNVLQPPVAVLCNSIFDMLVRIGLCRRPVKKFNIAHSMAPGTISIQMPGAAVGSATGPAGLTLPPSAEDAERRK